MVFDAALLNDSQRRNFKVLDFALLLCTKSHCTPEKSEQTNFFPLPPRDPNGFAVCATRFDSATRRCCFAQDDRGRNFCPKPIDARAYSAFADHKKSVKHSLASRFRRMFTRNEVNITAGKGALFYALLALTKPDTSCRDFCFFATFLSNKKVAPRFERRSLSL